jgi:hypothetical protein
MTIEKWLNEEKMRLGRFKIYYVNAQKDANVGEKPIVQYQITGTPKPLANPTECHAALENPTLLVA